MFKAIAAISLGFIVCTHALAGDVSCTEPSMPTQLLPPLSYDVAGKDRLYFYTAPNDKCRAKKLFVVPGDALIARREYKKWSKVDFFAKDGESYEGWVITKRLRFTGTAGNTEPKDVAFYEKAAKAAKAGKLGSPWAE